MSGLCSVSANPEVNRLVETCGYATAALTILPIPGSEIIGVMPLHVGMVIGIGQHHGRTLTRESASQLLLQIGATVGLSLVGSRLATTTAKFLLPGLGGIVAAPFMYASTLALGAVADHWFARDGAMSADEMKAVYDRTVRSAKGNYDRSRMHDEDVQEMAKDAVEQGQQDDPAGEPPRPSAV